MNFDTTDGLKTEKWGPVFWETLHLISLNYPLDPSEKEKKMFLSLIKSLKYILPCGICRKNICFTLKQMKWRKKKYYANRTNFIYFFTKFNTK